MTRPWLTLPTLLADHARTIRLLRLTTAELRGVNSMPPLEERCWRTTPQGRHWQADVQAYVDRISDGEATWTKQPIRYVTGATQ